MVSLDRLAVDELEAEEEGRTDLTCPYCYDDFDVGLLCSHLEDEHSHESRATVSVFHRLLSLYFIKSVGSSE